MSQTHRPLIPRPIHWILGLWAVVGVSIAIWFLSINSFAGDWQDVVSVVSIAFVVVCGLAIGLSWLIVRYFITGDSARVAVALLGPPALFGLIPFTLWLL
ncbi:MAG TPA: hypothetical protein VM848_04885 [Acidimicrobiia bacterium]|nr:hypothetical protein [Acidimicrobiia bacterium]